MGKITWFLFAMLTTGLAAADSSQKVMPKIGKITASEVFPVDRLVYFETDLGERGVMSENGRFVIVGDFNIVDTWSQKKVVDAEGVKAMRDLPIEYLKEPLEKTAHFVFGHGDTDVFIFTDLSSKYNMTLFSQISDEMMSKYRFNLVYSSLLNTKESLPINRAFLCAKDKEKAKEVLANFADNPAKLLTELGSLGEGASCNIEPLTRSALLAKTANVKRIPLVVNPQGKTFVEPKDLKGFLNAE
jgi:hypothetical protein